jgi:hypothetical protein
MLASARRAFQELLRGLRGALDREVGSAASQPSPRLSWSRQPTATLNVWGSGGSVMNT